MRFSACAVSDLESAACSPSRRGSDGASESATRFSLLLCLFVRRVFGPSASRVCVPGRVSVAARRPAGRWWGGRPFSPGSHVLRHMQPTRTCRARPDQTRAAHGEARRRGRECTTAARPLFSVFLPSLCACPRAPPRQCAWPGVSLVVRCVARTRPPHQNDHRPAGSRHHATTTPPPTKRACVRASATLTSAQTEERARRKDHL